MVVAEGRAAVGHQDANPAEPELPDTVAELEQQPAVRHAGGPRLGRGGSVGVEHDDREGNIWILIEAFESRGIVPFALNPDRLEIEARDELRHAIACAARLAVQDQQATAL